MLSMWNLGSCSVSVTVSRAWAELVRLAAACWTTGLCHFTMIREFLGWRGGVHWGAERRPHGVQSLRPGD